VCGRRRSWKWQLLIVCFSHEGSLLRRLCWPAGHTTRSVPSPSYLSYPQSYAVYVHHRVVVVLQRSSPLFPSHHAAGATGHTQPAQLPPARGIIITVTAGEGRSIVANRNIQPVGMWIASHSPLEPQIASALRLSPQLPVVGTRGLVHLPFVLLRPGLPLHVCARLVHTRPLRPHAPVPAQARSSTCNATRVVTAPVA
jgi:hypothetical protein